MEELKELIVDPLEPHDNSVANYQTLWNNEESDYVLQLWNENVVKIRSANGFRSKRCLWEDISKKLFEKFGIHRSAVQCEGRLKTLEKRERRAKRKHSEDERSEVWERSHSPPYNSLGPLEFDRASGNEKTEDSLQLSHIIVHTIKETMIEINNIKEVGKERRHREKIQLLARLLNKESVKAERENHIINPKIEGYWRN